MLAAALSLLLLSGAAVPAAAQLSWSAGLTSDAVFQRSATQGTAVYGFAASAEPVKVTVSGGSSSYTVSATPTPWVDTSGCNATGCIDAKTPLPPAHGAWMWRAQLKPQAAAGGSWTISATDGGSGANSTITLQRVTWGDVYFCSGQSVSCPLAPCPCSLLPPVPHPHLPTQAPTPTPIV